MPSPGASVRAVMSPTFTVRIADLERGPKSCEWELSCDWLKSAFEATELTAEAPGRAELTISKTGDRVLVEGHASVTVSLPCSRTLDPASYDLRAEVRLSLSPVAAPARPDRRAPRPGPETSGAAAGRTRRPQTAEERELSDQESEQDTYEGEQITLDDFLREFLLLEVPMMPLRSDLRADSEPAIPPSPRESVDGDPDFIDPRLQPLAAIAERLKNKKE